MLTSGFHICIYACSQNDNGQLGPGIRFLALGVNESKAGHKCSWVTLKITVGQQVLFCMSFYDSFLQKTVKKGQWD